MVKISEYSNLYFLTAPKTHMMKRLMKNEMERAIAMR